MAERKNGPIVGEAPWENDPIVGEAPWENDPETGGAMDYVLGAAGGFNKGLAAMGGMVVNPVLAGVRGASEAITGEPSEIPATLRGAVEKYIPGEYFPKPPEGMAGRVASRVGEEFGAAALPAGALMKAASGVPPVAKMGDKLGRRIWGAFSNPIKRSAGTAAAGEALATAGAGVGAAVARDAAPDSKVAETWGQLIGGVAPAAMAAVPSVMLFKTYRWAKGKYGNTAQVKKARSKIEEILGEELTDDAMAGIERGERLRDEIKGFEPSVAESSGAPGLRATQRDLEARASGTDLDQFVARRRGSEKAIEGFAADRAPEGQPSPEYVVDTASGRVEALRGAIDEQKALASGKRSDLADSVPIADRPGSGAAIREGLRTARDNTRSEMAVLARKLGIADEDITTAYTAWRNEIAAEFSPASKFEDVRKYPTVLKDIKNFGKGFAPKTDVPVSFMDVKALRERVGDDLRDAIGAANPSRKTIRHLSVLQKRVDDLVNTLGEGGDLAARYKEFRTRYFEDYIQKYEKGAAYKISQKDGRGFYRIPDERVANAFFKAGDVSAARQFNSVFADDQTARAALEAVALDSLRDGAVRDGVIDPRLLRTWVRKHRSVLDEFPDIQNAVRDADTVNNSLLARQAQLEGRARFVQDHLLTKTLQRYTQGTKTADQVLGEALKNPNIMREISGVLKRSKEGRMALRRTIWDMATANGAKNTAKFMSQNSDAVRYVFTDRHYKDLMKVAQARAMLEMVPSPTGAAHRPRPLEGIEKVIGQGVPQIGSRIFAFKSGRMQKGYLVLDTLLRGLRGRAQTTEDDILREALYDPVVARDMAGVMRSATLDTATARRLQARLFALGLPYLREQETE